LSSNFEKEIWLSSEHACNLLGIKKDTLRKNCCKDKYTYKAVRIDRKKEYQILLSSLSYEIQRKYWECDVKIEDQIELNLEIYNKAPKWAKEKVNKYLAILNESENLSGKELMEFIAQWNYENPDYKTSYCRVLDARKRYEVLQDSLQNMETMPVKQRLKRSGINTSKVYTLNKAVLLLKAAECSHTVLLFKPRILN